MHGLFLRGTGLTQVGPERYLCVVDGGARACCGDGRKGRVWRPALVEEDRECHRGTASVAVAAVHEEDVVIGPALEHVNPLTAEFLDQGFARPGDGDGDR